MTKNALSLLAAVAAGACGVDPTSLKNNTADTQSDLFAGFEVTGKSWDAVGSLAVAVHDPVLGDFYQGGLCTATLIGPSTILSAKHCSRGIFGTYEMYWVPGSQNAHDPEAVKYLLVDSWLADPSSGGSLEIGVDVSVFFTDAPVVDVAPLPVAAEPLTGADIDRPFYAIGYGTQNNAQDAGTQPTPGTRKLGKISLNAISGKKFEVLFGSYEGFIANLRSLRDLLGVDIDECLADAECAASVQELWNQELLADYEAYLGNRPGEAQACHGDSGGPLVGVVVEGGTAPRSAPAAQKVRKVYGVASNVWFAAEQACYGNFYATFGPQVQDLLAKSLAWTDPCGDATIQGACEGTVATRCTAPGEGPRRISTIDCAELDQVCAPLTKGKVGCTDPSADPAVDPTQPAGSPSQAREQVSKAFRGLTGVAGRLLR